MGLGGSGLAAVEELTARGLSVVGLDAGRVAAGAAGRNGGLLLGGTAPFFHGAVRDWGAEPATWLYRQTLAELDHLLDVLPAGVVRRSGSLRLAGGVDADDDERARELADCAAQAAALREHGIAVEEVSGAFGEGLFLPDDAQANPVVRHLGVLAHVQRAARDHGTRLHLHEGTHVRRIMPGRVETDRGVVSAGVVLVAVDGRLDVVLPQLGGEQPRVRTARLQMLATAPLDDDDAARVRERVPCGVYERWGYDYAQLDDGVPGRGPRLLVGGGRDVDPEAEWTTTTDPTPRVQTHVERVAERLLGRTLGAGEVAHRWGASVGYTAPDAAGRALCGLVDARVAAVGGYCGTGNLVGAVAARAAVRLLLDGERPPSCFIHPLRGHGQ
ncbi:Glycine/D-amino acid oxidase [Quadrisphaera granulorum]|uniref:Glycine/D-amino acid oxidase-like deaminating enzyme n=1 Tax=Quadrisphaera granulorum TaxID=317664 RepID=A0A315ZZJ2_9ACTN|nr:FAD-binding oxidoreductase [Quadrisphaera granulorum]PWJ50699.1 glycine/D-amino acid oxidase-like deaminating enzyme [Quadrisphaera granulorum]SZE97947.1 Glycine/D-amino acid oxidase [Quadrisphaera granulorum]